MESQGRRATRSTGPSGPMMRTYDSSATGFSPFGIGRIAPLVVFQNRCNRAKILRWPGWFRGHRCRMYSRCNPEEVEGALRQTLGNRERYGL